MAKKKTFSEFVRSSKKSMTLAERYKDYGRYLERRNKKK